MATSTNRYVRPLYLKLLHGNFLSLQGDDKKDFINLANDALQLLDEKIIQELLSSGWREQLVASWLSGLKRYRQFSDVIGELLAASKNAYAGQGFAFALACFSDNKSAQWVENYLQIYLPQMTLFYDQYWAMAALMWIDRGAKTNRADQFASLWEAYEQGKDVKLDDFWNRFVAIMSFCMESFL